MSEIRKMDFENRRYKQKGRMCYNTKNYDNPFFEKKTKFNQQAFFSLKVKIILFLILAVISLFIWFFVYSSFFQITKVIVEGEGRMDPKSVEEVIWSSLENKFFVLLPSDNYFLFSTSALRRRLESEFKLDYLEVKKQFRDTLIVTYKEKEYAYIWEEDTFFYYLDKNGLIVGEVPVEEMNVQKYPIISNNSSQKRNGDQTSVDLEYAEYAKVLFDKLKGDEKYVVEKFFVDDQKYRLKMKLYGGPLVYFNIQNEPSAQLQKLFVVIDEKLKDFYTNLEYIDLSIGDSVYYK